MTTDVFLDPEKRAAAMPLLQMGGVCIMVHTDLIAFKRDAYRKLLLPIQPNDGILISLRCHQKDCKYSFLPVLKQNRAHFIPVSKFKMFFYVRPHLWRRTANLLIKVKRKIQFFEIFLTRKKDAPRRAGNHGVTDLFGVEKKVKQPASRLQDDSDIL